ncbi:MAG: aminotransferase class IV [Phycisphaerales bacterium]
MSRELTIWLNGEFVEAERAEVSALDAGLQHGVGLFETMLGVGGKVFRLHKHLERLQVSARVLGLSESARINPLAEAVRRVVERAGLERARVRLTMTGGDLRMLGPAGSGATTPTVVITAQPVTERPREMFERGALVMVGSGRVNPLDPTAGHKTLNYWMRLRELREAARAGASEALMLQVTNHVAGGAVSNVFVVKDGVALTPIARGEEQEVAGEAQGGGAGEVSGRQSVRTLASPVLPGVTRAFVREALEARGVRVERRMLSVADVLDADEVFLTNSQWGALPVSRVEGKTIGAGSVGEMTRAVVEAWDAATVSGDEG